MKWKFAREAHNRQDKAFRSHYAEAFQDPALSPNLLAEKKRPASRSRDERLQVENPERFQWCLANKKQLLISIAKLEFKITDRMKNTFFVETHPYSDFDDFALRNNLPPLDPKTATLFHVLHVRASNIQRQLTKFIEKKPIHVFSDLRNWSLPDGASDADFDYLIADTDRHER